MDIHAVLIRVEDPVQGVCEDAVRSIPNRKISILTDYVMGHLPGPVPQWATTYVRTGVQRALKSELKRKGFVFRDGRYSRFADLSIREAWAYVNHLEESSARDRARIKSIKADIRRAERVAGGPESPRSIGDLLGWNEEEAA